GGVRRGPDVRGRGAPVPGRRGALVPHPGPRTEGGRWAGRPDRGGAAGVGSVATAPLAAMSPEPAHRLGRRGRLGRRRGPRRSGGRGGGWARAAPGPPPPRPDWDATCLDRATFSLRRARKELPLLRCELSCWGTAEDTPHPWISCWPSLEPLR